jgi:hypothetical protein
MKEPEALRKKLFVLDQMMKRHKIEADVNLDSAEIKIGKAKMSTQQVVIYFAIPTVLLILMIVVHLSLDLGRLKIYKFIYGLPITLLAYGANISLGNKDANATKKTFTKELCQIQGKKTVVTIPKDQIRELKTVLHTDDPSGLEGEVYLHTTESKKCLLFRIRGEKLNYLRDDLEKIKQTLNALWSLD